MSRAQSHIVYLNMFGSENTRVSKYIWEDSGKNLESQAAGAYNRWKQVEVTQESWLSLGFSFNTVDI